LVKGDLLHVKTSLADGVPCWRVKKALDGIGRGIIGGANVDRAINDSVATITQHADEFEGVIVDESAHSGGTREVAGRHCREGSEGPQEESLGKKGGGEGFRGGSGGRGVMPKRIEGLVLLRGRWAKPRGTGTTAACA
jgi:hypothetical protein